MTTSKCVFEKAKAQDITKGGLKERHMHILMNYNPCNVSDVIMAVKSFAFMYYLASQSCVWNVNPTLANVPGGGLILLLAHRCEIRIHT